MRHILTTGALSAGLLLSSSCLGQTPGAEWLTWNNGLHSQRFSSLSQITPDNAGQLGEVCRIQVDGPTSFHAGMIVDDGVIYTATGINTFALDARSCELIWSFDYEPEDPNCGGTNRGVALQNGRVFRGTCDGRLIALDASTGELLWKNTIAVPDLGEGSSGAPLAWNNYVFMGISGSDLGARGRVLGFDASTGQELWRFNTVPMGDETGAETWQDPETAKTGGGGVWGVMSLDVSSGELFVPVGNPWPDIDLGYRPGSNLFTNSIVVLDAKTGELKWWYQVSPADWKDLDLVAAPVLYRGEGSHDYMAIAGKDGYVTVVDRDTRELVWRQPVTTVEDIHDMPSPDGSRICPGFAGGVEWNGPALDKLNGTLITGAVDICFMVYLGNTVYTPNEVNFGGTIEPVGEATGWITALDKLTGEVKWQYQADKPVIAGITPTAGGVSFAGDLAGNLLVFDSASGELLLKRDLGGAMAGAMVTYELDGRQYVALNAGNISRNAFGDIGLPSVVILALDPEGTPTSLDATAIDTQGLANGRRLYSQVCSACHGANGGLVPDRNLATLASRLSFEEAVNVVKNPKAPMPVMYPDLISEQDVNDVLRFVFDNLQ